MREIKFRGLTEGGTCVYGDLINYENGRKAVIGRQLSAPGYLSVEGARISPVKAETIGQYTGLKDVNGNEVFEGDILNVFYKSDDGKHNHDCIYRAVFGVLNDIQFIFIGLMWRSHGYNQYPTSSTLKVEYGQLDYSYSQDLERYELLAPDRTSYFEVIGNIHQNPELLEQNDE